MKEKRQKKIIELVKENDLSTQEELSLLLEKAGFKVTQATISRDIRELNLMKASLEGRQRYVVPNKEEEGQKGKYVRVLREGFLSLERAHNLLVLKTVPGMAMAVAAALDHLSIKEIAGCIAGDDTIFLAIKEDEKTEACVDIIEKFLQ